MWTEWGNESDGHFVHTVLIEWDGRKPPTQWYNRLLRMGMHVAGDKSTSPLARRSTQHGEGVIHQEGAIMVESESQARILAQLAKSCGARAVTVGIMEIRSTDLTPDDQAALSRIKHTLGKRGRPSETKAWAVTCLDCLSTQAVDATTPVNCPSCGSFKIQFREGAPVKLLPERVSPAELWKIWETSRFVDGVFEIPHFTTDGVKRSDQTVVHTNQNDGARTQAMSASPLLHTLKLLLDLGKIDSGEAMRALDEAYRSLGLSADERQRQRLMGLQKYFVLGGQQDGILLTAKPDSLDIFDVVSRLRANQFLTPIINIGTSALGLDGGQS